ncbi:hypothetical protein C1878_02180 [Gordonibacter sp. 28C]|uniref:LysR family transcriptional regulator n=1 Tax=Gordonibacter sp. 28C TaxID=2078569 RepID=UPI000DF809D0|nr:LysR family transcriptional regulator [Gordonibacter sp. 28C]RDB64668.1 hypothetical protein C1878_02180 [Gordonibacter sp. 28C]
MDDNAPYLIAIADEGSISKAAQRMHLSQPALSQRLKQLEGQLGVTLFDRSHTPLAPTHACQIYLEWARKAVEAEHEMRREVSAVASNAVRRLQIGTSIPRANSMLPDIVARFYRERKGCVVSLHDAGVPETHNHLLAASEIDCAILTPVRPEPSLCRGEALCDELMLLAAPSTWNLPAKKARDGGLPVVEPSAIANLPFIMPPRQLKHAWAIRTMMDTAGARLDVLMHSCSNEMTWEMIRRGLGVSIAPNTFTLSQPKDQLAYYRIDGFASLGHLYYNRRIDRSPSEDEKAFVSMVKEWISEHPLLASANAEQSMPL